MPRLHSLASLRGTALVLGALAALMPPSFGGCGPRPRPRPDVLLITVDTLRADRVHSYGFPGETTPHIDALAARGARFETAIAASAATVPSHASIMTARFAREHSVGPKNGATRLEGVATLAERFASGGYDTAAFVGNVLLKRRSGLDRGFAVYDDELPAIELNRPIYQERSAESTVRRATAWLADRDASPVFLWVHLQDPHGPYSPPAPWDAWTAAPPGRPEPPLRVLEGNFGAGGIPAYQRIGDLRLPSEYARRYAGEIAYTDHWIGELVRAFEAERPGREAVILLTSDHGESLGESGFWFQHGHTTAPELALVPFVLVAPGIARQRRSEPVSHVDVAPTLLDLAGLPPLPGASGLALTRFLERGEPIPERVLFCDTLLEASAYHGSSRLKASSGSGGAAGRKLGWSGFQRTDESWVAAPLDPGLQRRIRSYLGGQVPMAYAPRPSDEEVEHLRALGYLPPAEGSAEDPEPRRAAAGAPD